LDVGRRLAPAALRLGAILQREGATAQRRDVKSFFLRRAFAPLRLLSKIQGLPAAEVTQSMQRRHSSERLDLGC
jgi:hypothetical protein